MKQYLLKLLVQRKVSLNEKTFSKSALFHKTKKAYRIEKLFYTSNFKRAFSEL